MYQEGNQPKWILPKHAALVLDLYATKSASFLIDLPKQAWML